MSRAEDQDLTLLLERWSSGDDGARDMLVPVVYDELRRIAGGHLKREWAGHTLQPTALVNEALIRLFQQSHPPDKGRGQLFGLMSKLMRRVLVDHARGRAAEKRGGDYQRVTPADTVAGVAQSSFDVLEFDRALEKLAAMDARQAEIVELRVFGGCEVTEVAQALEISPATVKRDWRSARAWLHREL